MARELGSSQISALLESVPGIVNVLRSPVADAMVAMIRAGAGLDEFDMDSAKELVQYAVRRGLISSGEGEQLLEDVRASGAGKGRRRKSTGRKGAVPRTPAAGVRTAKRTKPTPPAKRTAAAKKKPFKAKPPKPKPKSKPKPKPKPKSKAKTKKPATSRAKPVNRSKRR